MMDEALEKQVKEITFLVNRIVEIYHQIRYDQMRYADEYFNQRGTLMEDENVSDNKT